MTAPCNTLTPGPAQDLCLHLTDPQSGYALAPNALDGGAQEVQFLRTGRPAPKDFFTRILTKGKDDGRQSAPEVFQRVLQLAPTQPRLAAFLKGKMEIPWISSTHQSISPDEKKLEEWMDKKIAALKISLAERKLAEGSFAYTLAMGEGLFELLIGKEGSKAESLNLVMDEDLDQAEKSLGEIYRAKKANCLEYTLLYFWAAQKAGIEVVPIASYRDNTGDIQDHVMVGFKNPRSKNIEKVADIGFKYFGTPDTKEVLGEIPTVELWAQWFNAQGWKGMDQVRAEDYVDLALQMAPNNFLFLYNKGVYRLKAQDYGNAKKFFLASIQSNPNYPNSYHNLYFAAEGLEDQKLAQWAKKKFYALPENLDKTGD